MELDVTTTAEILKITAIVLYLLQAEATRNHLAQNGGRTLRRSRTMFKALFWPAYILKALSRKLARLAKEGQ